MSYAPLFFFASNLTPLILTQNLSLSISLSTKRGCGGCRNPFLVSVIAETRHLIWNHTKLKNEPQNRRISNVECRRMESLRSVYLKIGRIHYSMLDVQCSMFDVHLFLNWSDWTLAARGGAYMKPHEVKKRTAEPQNNEPQNFEGRYRYAHSIFS